MLEPESCNRVIVFIDKMTELFVTRIFFESKLICEFGKTQTRVVHEKTSSTFFFIAI
jgi:hypothetical protein